MSKDKKRSTTDTARRIWLAGIGAYGRAFTEAQGAIKDVTGKSSDVFDELVQKGEMIEMVVAAKRKDIVEKAVDRAMPDIKVPEIKMPDLHIDERIKKMRARLSGTDLPYTQETATESVEVRLEALEAKLDKILALLEPKTSVRKATTKPVKTPKGAQKAKTNAKPKPKSKTSASKPTTRTQLTQKPTAKPKPKTGPAS